MGLTRAFLKGMGLTEEQVGAIIEEHVDTTNALKEQRDTYKKDADKLAEVQKELDGMKTDGGSWQDKYNNEHKAFEAYKAEIDAKQVTADKQAAYKALLKAANVSDARIDTVLKVTDLSEFEMKDGKFTNEDELTENIKNEWSDFIVTTQTNGANTVTPPAISTGTKMSKEDILNISDTAARQKAIAENHELFGF